MQHVLQMFLEEINATTTVSQYPPLYSDVNSGLSQAFLGELCHPLRNVWPILSYIPATGNIGLFYLSPQPLTLTSRCCSVKRKTNEQKEKHSLLCFSTSIPGENYQSIFVSAVESTLYLLE